MAKFMLIGGGNVGRGNSEYETDIIDKEIVKMANKDNPNFLFVGLASSFSDSYYDTMKKIYKELGCTCSYLKKKNILNNPDIVKNKIKMADIIYFCGGDSIKLVNDLKEYKIDILLKEAIAEDTVVAGMSAGAIMLCREGYSDSLKLRGESNNYEFVLGLGTLNISICPHFDLESDKGEELKKDILKCDSNVVGIPDKTAIKIENDKYKVISLNGDIYNCYFDGKFKCDVLKKEGLISEIVL